VQVDQNTAHIEDIGRLRLYAEEDGSADR
jgi:hypothetical protein